MIFSRGEEYYSTDLWEELVKQKSMLYNSYVFSQFINHASNQYGLHEKYHKIKLTEIPNHFTYIWRILFEAESLIEGKDLSMDKEGESGEIINNIENGVYELPQLEEMTNTKIQSIQNKILLINQDENTQTEENSKKQKKTPDNL